MAEGLRITNRAVSGLIPYARNARTHNKAQVQQIVASIREYGWTNPVLIDGRGEIIAGHGRVMAAKELGRETVPCIVLKGLSEAQKRAYRIADNKIPLNAGWDEEALRLELEELRLEVPDISLTGFEEVVVDKMIDGAARAAGLDDHGLELPEKPTTRPGDLWALGSHRLKCGDAERAEDVGQLLDGAEPHLMVTDPPYGVNYDPTFRATAPGLWTIGKRVASKKPENDFKASWFEAWKLFPGDVVYCWHADRFADIVGRDFRTLGFEIRAQIVWDKGRIVIGRGNYHYQHEPCFYFVRKGKKARWNGGRKQTTVWQINHGASDTGHSTQKPIEAMRRPILNNSRKGDAVYDPFLGSGTTLIAAEMEGRICYGLELAPEYCDLTVARWEKMTGEKAKRI